MLRFTENDIDGEALLSLTERALEQLVPIIGHRMNFLSTLEKLKKDSAKRTAVHRVDEPVHTCINEKGTAPSRDKECEQQTRYLNINILTNALKLRIVLAYRLV